MDSLRWQQVKQILGAALQLSEDQRSSFLHSIEAEDPTLFDEVESLLADDQARSSFLESPPLPRLSEGTLLGDYEIQSMLGAGGMGEVYRARDLRLRRI